MDRSLDLYFVRNVTNDTWIGSPMHGAEEVDWDEAYAFVSPGDALSVMEQLQRRSKSLARRIMGFFTHRGPDEFTIIPLSLDEPDEDDENEGEGYAHAVGEMVEAPVDDEEPFDEEYPDEERLEDGIARVVSERVRSIKRKARSLVARTAPTPTPWGIPEDEAA